MPTTKVNKVVIRMYKIGTGDCFVLKFFAGDDEKFKMMIDCGACVGDSKLFTSFVKSINTYVDNHIDLLVVTHEHLDHIIGFARGKTEFDHMDIDKVWVAWTENPENKLAKKLKKDYGKKKKSFALAINKMQNIINSPGYKSTNKNEYYGALALNARKTFLYRLIDAFGLYYDPSQIKLAAKGDGGEMQKAMDFVLKGISAKTNESPGYLYPGKAVPEINSLPGIKFYVLGPPENEALLKKEEIKDDVYHRKFYIDDDHGFMTALTGDDSDASEVIPFSKSYICSGPKKRQFAKKHLMGPENSWRNIDIDWLNNAGKLAIRLEKYVNNTSLVLAIEFEDSGKVLLFPGDAQSGNWKSWHESSLNWKVKEGNKIKTITAKDLLERTVFYKVGHHFSHNGTASKSGLDLMNSEELTAFATLDYNAIKPGWKNTMPAPGLMDELIKRTKGRIFRIDEGLIKKSAAEVERGTMSSSEAKTFEDSYKIEKEFIEYTVEG